jgi:hypothetical protein
MTTYDDRNGPVYAEDDTQVQRTLPTQRTDYAEPSHSAEATYGFEPPVASDDYPAEALQRKRFGGANWGAGFFGWLVAVAMTTLLAAVAAAVVLGLGTTGEAVPADLESTPNGGVAAAAVGLAIVMLAYFCGGYVAGRMSRFDGGRQGLAVWLVGLLLTGAAVGLGLVFGPQVTLPDQVDLPAPELAASATGITVLVAVAVTLVCGLVAAVLGGKVGCRYHRKVDDAAYV